MMRNGVFLGSVLMLLSVPQAQGREDSPAKAWTRCAQCHQPPDLQMATDQAWLDQVRRTG